MPEQITYVVNSIQFFFSHRLPLAKKAVADGFQVSVCAPSAGDTPRERLRSEGITFVPAWFQRKGVRLWHAARWMLQGFWLSGVQRVKVVHLITLFPIVCWGLPLRLRGRRVVYALTGMGSVFGDDVPWVYRCVRPVLMVYLGFLFRHPKATVIVQNQDDQDYLCSRLRLTTDSVVLIRGSGVDVEAFPFQESRAEACPPVFLFGARLIAEKGLEDLVKASQLLTARGFNHEFWVAGTVDPGNPRSHTPQQIERWQKDTPGMRVLGAVQDMRSLFEKATAVILPSVYREGVPKFLLEGAAMGRPLICYDVPGCREIVLHEKTGLAVEAGDVQALADAMHRLATTPVLADRLRRAAYQRFQDLFTLETVVKRTLDLYSR